MQTHQNKKHLGATNIRFKNVRNGERAYHPATHFALAIRKDTDTMMSTLSPQ